MSDVFIENPKRDELRRGGVPVPFQVEVEVVGRSDVTVASAGEVDINIKVFGYLLGLRKGVTLRCAQAKRVAVDGIPTKRERRKVVEFVERGGLLISDRHIDLVELEADVSRKARREAVGSLDEGGVGILRDAVIVSDGGRKAELAGGESLGVVELIEVDVDVHAIGAEVEGAVEVLRSIEAVANETTTVTEGDVGVVDVGIGSEFPTDIGLEVEVGFGECGEEAFLGVTTGSGEAAVALEREVVLAAVGLVALDGVICSADVELPTVGEIEAGNELVGEKEIVVTLLAAHKAGVILVGVTVAIDAEVLANVLVAGVDEHKVVSEAVAGVEAKVEVGEGELVDGDGGDGALLVAKVMVLLIGTTNGFVGVRVVGRVGSNNEERKRVGAIGTKIPTFTAGERVRVVQGEGDGRGSEAVGKVEAGRVGRLSRTAGAKVIDPVEFFEGVGAEGLGISTAGKADGELLVTGKLLGADVDNGTSDVTAGRSAKNFVYADRRDDVGTKELEGDVFIFGILAGKRKTIEERGVVTVAEAADEDVLNALLVGNTGNLSNSGTSVGDTLTRHFISADGLDGDQVLALVRKSDVLTLVVDLSSDDNLLKADTIGGDEGDLDGNVVAGFEDKVLAENLVTEVGGDNGDGSGSDVRYGELAVRIGSCTERCSLDEDGGTDEALAGSGVSNDSFNRCFGLGSQCRYGEAEEKRKKSFFHSAKKAQSCYAMITGRIILS